MTYRIAHKPDGTLHGFGPDDQYEPAGDNLTITLSDAPPAVSEPVPQVVTMAQGRAALILLGLDLAVESAIDAIVDPVQRKLAWNDYSNRNTWERSNPRLQAIATGLGFDLDALFTLAAQQ